MIRLVSLSVLALLLGVLVVGCADGDDGEPETRTPGEPLEIMIWHSMPEPAGGALQRIADEFNASQDDYQVRLVFQGSYTESLNKLISSSGAENIPAAIQLSDASTQIMVDSGAVTPIQDFIDEEEYDTSDFEPRALAYYTVDDAFYAMPFNLSGPILYYDRQAFEDAGLDPDDPPTTLDEVRAYSEQLVVRNDDSSIARYGIALQTSAWYFEQMLAMGGGLYVDGENGRAERATEALFDNEVGIEIITWWAGMVEDELAYHAGSDAVNAMLKLASGEAAMTIGSTAALRAAIAAVTLVGRDPFQYDTAPMPGPEGDGGVSVGGASLWILSGRPESEQRGAWDFIKFAAKPDQQAQWHSDTGYFPNRLSAYDEPPAVQAREEFPQFMTAVEQLRASPNTPAASGVLLGPLTGVRDRVLRAFDQVLAGGGDPAQELAAAAAAANELIEEYNRTAP